jgi:stearoyl-CoA desaturase (delta-9 desaturase)
MRRMAVAVPPVLVVDEKEADKLRWRENLPFWAVHAVAAYLAWRTGWSMAAFWWLLGGYLVRIFVITGGYHRYFSHRTFKTSRAFQFILAALTPMTVQKGPLWWAAHHRNHHKYSDLPGDIHSPKLKGFWWSHMMWILAKRYRETDYAKIPDLAKYPELVWINKYEMVLVVAYGAAFALLGGMTGLTWGFFVSIVMCWHFTFFINSLAHVWGNRRYPTTDTSRNNFLLGLLLFGEGWHNNHHYYQRAARQGFFWWEVDFTYYILKGLEVFHIVWDVQGVPDHVRDQTLSTSRKRLKSTPVVVPEVAAVVEPAPVVKAAKAEASAAIVN